MQIKLLWIGKTKNAAVQSLVSDYLGRIRHMVPCEIVETRDLSKRKSLNPAELVKSEGEELAKHVPESGVLVALDEKGTELTSEGFARWIESEQNSGVRVISFVIGGHEGLSPVLSRRARLILSMGKMTWTHEMCRALLLEQIYRSFCILRNIPYHRGGN